MLAVGTSITITLAITLHIQYSGKTKAYGRLSCSTECVKMLKYVVATYCGALTPHLAKSLEFEQTP